MQIAPHSPHRKRRSASKAERRRPSVISRMRRTGPLTPEMAARRAKLVYLLDDQPGIRREKQGNRFVYRSPRGRLIRSDSVLRRIRTLAIPPAWTDVWISPLSNGHLQATGRDARGRKQYRYHAQWREIRDATKFDRLAQFAEAVVEIRNRIPGALALSGLPREKVLAAVIRLLDVTFIRVGNEEYAAENGSFGLTTLRNRHLDLDGSRLRLKFRGKSGVRHSIDVVDRRLARVVQRCSELPGELLFQFVDDQGEVRPIGSSDVNEQLKEWTGQDFTAKDFRTWAGSVLFLKSLLDATEEQPLSLTETIRAVAEHLGNTPTVCRKYYIHPRLIAAFTEHARIQAISQESSSVDGPLSREECLFVEFLRQS